MYRQHSHVCLQKGERTMGQLVSEDEYNMHIQFVIHYLEYMIYLK
jgi:hypothetical protein